MPIGTTHESTRRTVASGIRRSASAFTSFPLLFGVLPPGRPRPNPKQCRAGTGRGRDRRESRGGPRDERRDDGRELGAAVLLEEVAAALDGGVRLPRRARDRRQHRPVATAGDRVLVGERAQERAVEATEYLPRGPVGRGGGVVGARRHQERELTGPLLVRLVGERCVVSRDDVVGQRRGAAAVD